MLRFFGPEIKALNGQQPIVTIGMFDGVHIGHQRVVAETCSWAEDLKAPCVGITFDVHPVKVIHPEKSPPMVTSLEHRLRLLERHGLSACMVIHFNQQTAAVSAIDFVKDILVDKLNARGVVVGWDAGFGRDREGDLGFLKQIAGDFNLKIRGVDPVKIDNEIVSSTAVRNAVASAKLDLARAMLGRPMSILGTVVTGRGIGRKLGFPTLNLNPHHELRPLRGVYITRTRCGDTLWPSVTNIGNNPTVAGGLGEDVLVETHLLENGYNLYGQIVDVEFLRRLRAEMHFLNTCDLQAQIVSDVKEAREYFSKNPLREV